MSEKPKIETFVTRTSEVFATGSGISISATPWGNHEGLSYIINDDKGGMRTAASMRWGGGGELDVMLAALSMARAV